MSSSITQANSDDLREEFHRLYGDGHDFEGEKLIEILVTMGQLVGEIVGREDADAAFATLTRRLDYEFSIDADWAETLKDRASGDAYCWPMGARLHNLNAYAYWGIALNGGQTAGEREAELRAEIAVVDSFMARVPFSAWGFSDGDAGRTLRRAKGRFALDTDEPIEPDVLALLGGVSERRIRNLMAGKERVFTVDESGRVPAAEALSWLAGRPKEFRPSRWRDQNTFEDLVRPTKIEEVNFVPVAADNSVFHPGLARAGVYTVGRGDHEAQHETYETALLALQQMTDPAWPRPTPRGLWTTVTAVRWARYGRAELNYIAATPRTTETEGA
jgi:hypothetical protein